MQNSVTATKSGGAQSFWPKTEKFGLIRQKRSQNKLCRARRVRRVTRKTRVEHDKHTFRVQNFNVFRYGTIHCEIANSFPPAGLAPVSDGATLKPQTACHRRTAPFWNAVEVRTTRSSIE
jgi:hypothetical protein